MIRYKIMEFASRLGISAATVRRWEREGTLPSHPQGQT
ncbi:MAG: MerR family DNA-binding transcriptional regulator [Treponema sp.]|nr:MerR family DNA-binding transcriptional regulator [Treponema sp.]